MKDIAESNFLPSLLVLFDMFVILFKVITFGWLDDVDDVAVDDGEIHCWPWDCIKLPK